MGTTLFDKSLAEKFLTELKYDGQRRMREHRIKYLAHEMENGRFLSGTAIHVAVLPDKKAYLVNGQHTLSAISRCGVPQELTVIEIACKAMEDVAMAYGSIDTQLKRSTSDMFAALGLVDELNLTKTEINKLGSGVKILRHEFNASQISRLSQTLHPDQLVAWIRDHAPEAIMYFDAIDGAPSHVTTGLQRGATVAVALATYRFSTLHYGVDVVTNFWKQAAFSDGLSIGDPRKLAHTHLITTGFSGGGSKNTSKNIVSEGYSARYLALCVNAYFEGRQLTKTFVRDVNAPVHISGTPFTGESYGIVFGASKD